MPLLDHFHPPLHGPRRWEGFHHAWATFIAQQLNQQTLPAGYFAESEISLGPELEIDVAAMRGTGGDLPAYSAAPPTAARPPYGLLRSRPSRRGSSSRTLKGTKYVCTRTSAAPSCRGAIELVSPANKDRAGSRRTFAAKCAGYLRQGVGLVIVDVVTARSADLHAELFEVLEAVATPSGWKSPTGLYAVAYRPVTVRHDPRLEMWPEALALGKPLPVMPLWLANDLCVPLWLEDSYTATCRSLRISAA